MTPKLDDTPLDTDWDSFKELWEDVKGFMKTHPDHIILCADDPVRGRWGWVAYIPGGVEDEQEKEWTIPLSCITDPATKQSLTTSEGKLEMIRALRPKTLN
ncbi:hypothetical protein M0R72_03015 [Candidatus Pacearchaeota archaeon]|jgi:hypothetical protein|nr:hypothetical protein [Candidatus Pacearchaeota archaeon]